MPPEQQNRKTTRLNSIRAALVLFALTMLPFRLFGAILQSQPSGTSITETEAAQLADAFVSGMEKTGDIRKLDHKLFHHLFLEGFCMAPPQLCAKLHPADAREFSYSIINVMWIVYEHQLALPNPVYLHPSKMADQRQFLKDLLPDEVREMFTAEENSAFMDMQSVDGFNKAKEFYAKLEGRLQEERTQHDHVHRSIYEKNRALVQARALPPNGIRFAPVGTGNGSATAFRYMKFPFFLYVAKENGTPVILSIVPVTD